MDQLVSVVVPVYKVEKYLQRCIDSIKNQTYANLEIILVDDGSPDNCPSICDENRIMDNRIIVIHKENGGLSSARNAGMKIMTGRYVTFVDSDDFLDLKAIEIWMNHILTYEADMVVGNFQDYHNEADMLELGHTDIQIISPEQMMRKMLVENDRLCVAWGKLYKVELFELIRYPENVKFAEDMFVIHKLFHLSNRIIYDNNKYYYYNQEGESLVRSKFTMDKLKRVDAIKEWLDFVDDKYPNLHEEAFAWYVINLMTACTQLISICDSTGYLERYLSTISKSYSEIKVNQYIKKRDKIKAYLLQKKKLLLYKLIRQLFARG